MRGDLPTGTVTFLFTDVEGSTKLLHELGAEGYAEALAEHRRVIREACAAYGGVEVDTQGDAFFVAFPTAPGALAAAESMTEGLATGPIHVRIGLHTGTPLLAEEGYVGDDVHFAARVAATSHGGQVVLSQGAADLVDLELTDLGEHRLKDIPQAVPIFQLGNGSFPPLKTISNTNLPTPASSFVGRDDELLEVLSRIEEGARLVTLTGPGGTGKTRLAIEAASELVTEYKAGIFWVALATLRDPALVTETIAQTLGAKDGLAGHVGEREMLLLLDNLEQVVDCAPELAKLLAACPNLTLLVTSRELLRIQGEVEYAVPPLAEQDATELFCARAQLEPSEEIAELCARLDNLPLAVELAAARTNVLTPEQILARISQRLDLLKGGRDADPRQQTLRTTIEWSHQLLSPEEQRLFARLSVFVGGCTLEAAEEVADAGLDTIQSLVEKSLLRFTDGRYWMLETIREYATERLEGSAEVDGCRGRHADFVLRLAREVGEAAGTRPELLHAFAHEQDNFRAALAWLRHSHRFADQLDLVGETWPFWADRGLWSEAMRWVEAALRDSTEQSTARAKVLLAGAGFAYRLGDLEELRRYADEAFQLSGELRESVLRARSGMFLALVAHEHGEEDRATSLFEETIRAAREGGDANLVGIAISNLGDIALRSEDFATATSRFEESLAISRSLGNPTAAAGDLNNLALSLYASGRRKEAVRAASESLLLAQEAEAIVPLLMDIALAAAVAAADGKPDVAAALLGKTASLCEEVEFELTGFESELQERSSARVRSTLDEESYAAAFARGEAMALDDAIQLALGCLD